MGSKGSATQTSNQTQSYEANPAISAAAQQALSGAQAAASQPFQTPVAPVAGFTQDQLAAFQNVRGMQGMAQPYFNQAANYTNMSAQPISAGQVENYLNPYAKYALSGLNETLGVQNRDLQGQLTQAAGGVGADRVAVGQAEKFRQDQLARGQLMSSLYQPALQAAQADAGRQANAGYAMGNLGIGAQGAALQGTQALMGAGNQQQAQQQAQLNAPYQNELQRIAYQFQAPQYLAGIAGGLGPTLGGTTSGQSQTTSTPAQPSVLSQIAGGLMAAGGLMTGNPMMAMGGAGSMFGGSGGKGGGSNPSNAAYGSNPFTPYGTMNPAYGNRGGRMLAAGGAVDPSMVMRGFAEGGDTFANRWGAVTDAADSGIFDMQGASMPMGRPMVNLPMPAPRPDIPQMAPMPPVEDVAPPTDASAARNFAMPPLNPSGGMGLTNTEPRGPGFGAAGSRDFGPLMPPMPASEMPYPDSRERNSGQQFIRSPSAALVRAGLAMMAGTSPWAGVNIGKGGLEGLKALEDQRKESREEESVNIRAKQLWQDAQKHLDTYRKPTAYQEADLTQRKALLDKQLKQLELEGMKPFKIGEDPLTGLDIYGIRDPKSGQMVPIDPNTGRAKGSAESGAPTQQQIEQQAKPEAPPPLGIPEFKPDLAPTKIQGPQMMKGPFATNEAQNIKAIDAQMNKSRDGLDTQRDQLTRMKQDFATIMKNDGEGFFKKMMTTPGLPVDPILRVKAMNAANATAMAKGKPPVFDPAKVAAMEEIIKIQTTMGFTFASTVSPREAIQGQLKAMEAQPNLTQSPQGMQRLIGLYDGLLNAGEARHSFWAKWKQTNPRTSTGWDEDFRSKNPMEKFTVRALIENAPNQRAVAALPQAVEWLRANKSNPAEIAKFDKLYNNTSSYFLTGKLDPYAAIR